MTDSEWTRALSVRMPATHRGVRVVRHQVRHFARLEGVAEGEIDSLCLVVSELLANVVDHGGGGGAMTEEDLIVPVEMGLDFELSAVSWRMTVSDQGGGDPEEVRALLKSEEPPDLEDARGRGLFLMRETVDELSARASSDGLGIAIVAVRNFQAPGEGASA